MTTCGTGGWSGPVPGDPDNNVFLYAQAVFGGIRLSWTMPGLNAHAVSHVQIYRNTVNNWDTAMYLNIEGGSWYFDQIDSETAIQYWYWIRIMSINGTLGEPVGPATAIYGPTVAAVIDMLSGQIDQSMLAGYLSTQIAQIELNRLGITQEMLDRDAADDSLGVALTVIEAHSDETRALLQEEVLARTDADGAIVSSVNTLWAEHNANVAAVQVETNARISADEALANQITTAQTTLNGNIASVQTTLETQIEVLDGEVTNIGARWTAVVDVNGLVGGFGIHNNGTVVDAGFNVDNFWIGKPGVGGAPGVYPFIVVGGKVYMKSAMISQLTADQIDTRGLTLKDMAGNVIFSAGTGLEHTYVDGLGDLATQNQVDWNTQITNIPYDKMVANDDAVTLGLNPSFEDWTGTYPAGWGLELGTGTTTKETSLGLVRHGTIAWRASVSGGNQYYFGRTVSWTSTPMAVGTFISGSIDMNLVTRTSGLPGIMIRLFTNAALSTWVDTHVLPPSTSTGMWQRVPFTARVGAAERIYGMRVYIMPSYSGFTSGVFTGTVVYDALKLAFFDTSMDNKAITLTGSNGTISITGAGGGSATGVVMPGNPINSGNISTYIQSAAIDTLRLGGNVVTIPAVDVWSGDVTANGGMFYYAQATITIPAGVGSTKVLVCWATEQSSEVAEPGWMEVAIVRGGTDVYRSRKSGTTRMTRAVGDFTAGIAVDTVAAGATYSYTLYWGAQNSAVHIYRGSIWVMAAMR